MLIFCWFMCWSSWTGCPGLVAASFSFELDPILFKGLTLAGIVSCTLTEVWKECRKIQNLNDWHKNSVSHASDCFQVHSTNDVRSTIYKIIISILIPVKWAQVENFNILNVDFNSMPYLGPCRLCFWWHRNEIDTIWINLCDLKSDPFQQHICAQKWTIFRLYWTTLWIIFVRIQQN